MPRSARFNPSQASRVFEAALAEFVGRPVDLELIDQVERRVRSVVVILPQLMDMPGEGNPKDG